MNRASSRSSYACLTAVTLSISASCAIVFGSMSMTTRVGMLYATIGLSVSAAISSKWRTIARCGGLL
jgi:hypothetical protein